MQLLWARTIAPISSSLIVNERPYASTCPRLVPTEAAAVRATHLHARNLQKNSLRQIRSASPGLWVTRPHASLSSLFREVVFCTSTVLKGPEWRDIFADMVMSVSPLWFWAYISIILQAITSIAVHPTRPHIFCTTSRDTSARIYDLTLAPMEHPNNPHWPPDKRPSLAGAAHGLHMNEREGSGLGRCIIVLMGSRSGGHQAAVFGAVSCHSVESSSCLRRV